jgi:hypothetical protein
MTTPECHFSGYQIAVGFGSNAAKARNSQKFFGSFFLKRTAC